MEIDFTARCGLYRFLIRIMIQKLGLGVELCDEEFQGGGEKSTRTPELLISSELETKA